MLEEGLEVLFPPQLPHAGELHVKAEQTWEKCGFGRDFSSIPHPLLFYAKMRTNPLSHRAWVYM